MNTTDSVWCQGGEGAEGHPKIYLNYSKQGWVICPYCSQRFEKEVV